MALEVELETYQKKLPELLSNEGKFALVHGEGATVKRFYREPGGWIRLQPANDTVQPLRLNERDVIVQGVVVGVIRKY